MTEARGPSSAALRREAALELVANGHEPGRAVELVEELEAALEDHQVTQTELGQQSEHAKNQATAELLKLGRQDSVKIREQEAHIERLEDKVRDQLDSTRKVCHEKLDARKARIEELDEERTKLNLEIGGYIQESGRLHARIEELEGAIRTHRDESRRMASHRRCYACLFEEDDS